MRPELPVSSSRMRPQLDCAFHHHGDLMEMVVITGGTGEHICRRGRKVGEGRKIVDLPLQGGDAGASRKIVDLPLRGGDAGASRKIVDLPLRGGDGGASRKIVDLPLRGGDGDGEEAVARLEVGDLLVIQAGEEHCYRRAEGLQLINFQFLPLQSWLDLDDLVQSSIYHQLFTLEPRLRKRLSLSPQFRIPGGRLEEMNALLASVEESLRARGPAARFRSKGLFMQLIGFLVEEARPTFGAAETLPQEWERVRKMGEVASFIESRIHDRMTLSGIARHSGMSETALLKSFKACFQRSPIEYLIVARIRRSKSLLADTALSVSEVAARSGFDDPNYFSRQFRKVVGVSPRMYRRGSVSR